MNINFPHQYFEETESTNLEALKLLSKTNPAHGFAVITDYQTAGKGQYGRTWQSQRAVNLLFSVILGPLNINIHEIFKLHLVSSIALKRSLQKLGIENISIKWPNDIYVNQKKIAGILIQNQLKESKVEWAVIGIGLNVNQSEFENLQDATSLFIETGSAQDRSLILSEIRSNVLKLILTNTENEWNQLLTEYNSDLYLREKWISVISKDGNKFSAKIKSVTNEGKLRLEIAPYKFQDFTFGEIQYVKK